MTTAGGCAGKDSEWGIVKKQAWIAIANEDMGKKYDRDVLDA